MRDVMLDLETMGTGPRAAIVAIGAVVFDLRSRMIADTFYTAVDLGSSMRTGGHVDAMTIYWWLQQSEEARQALLVKDPLQLPAALCQFSEFISQCTEGQEHVRVWGNGSDFDNVILGSAYDRQHLSKPWRFYHNRCYRTVKNLFRDVPVPPREESAKHNALSDALFQARHLITIASLHPFILTAADGQ